MRNIVPHRQHRIYLLNHRDSTRNKNKLESSGRGTKGKSTKEDDDERHMRLIDERLSEYGAPLQVYYCDDEYEIPSFRNTTILIRSTAPDAVLSELRNGRDDSGTVELTGGVFDLFALAVALIEAPTATTTDTTTTLADEINVGILGLGCGTCLRLIDDLYPHRKIKMFGYELDEAIVDLGYKHFGLDQLKTLEEVFIGDALENIETRNKDVLYDLIIVDLFDDQSRIIPELLSLEKWTAISKKLRHKGKSRVICNLSTGRGRGANISAAVQCAELIAETCSTSAGDISIWPSGRMNVWNEVCISGPLPLSFGVEETPKILAKYCSHFISTSKYINNDDNDKSEIEDVPLHGWLLDQLSRQEQRRQRN